MGSGWSRHVREKLAAREDGLTVTRDETGWRLGAASEARFLSDVPRHSEEPMRLEEAIAWADTIVPPAGWRKHGGTWVAEGWQVVPALLGDKISWRAQVLAQPPPAKGPRWRYATSQVFLLPDRARAWCELRNNGAGRRGPRLRAGTPSTTTWPDVRVTVAEREAVVAQAAQLKLSFAVYARLAFAHTSQLLFETGTLTLAKRLDTGAFELVPTDKALAPGAPYHVVYAKRAE